MTQDAARLCYDPPGTNLLDIFCSSTAALTSHKYYMSCSHDQRTMYVGKEDLEAWLLAMFKCNAKVEGS